MRELPLHLSRNKNTGYRSKKFLCTFIQLDVYIERKKEKPLIKEVVEERSMWKRDHATTFVVN